ncbi:MAG: phosphohydrolase, partial [Oscillospiraceae bacterium]|nr:phosphohydrolase [Oscillospiraceae bacterium]
EGLNLSLQVLDGVLAHNGEILQSRYEPDRTKTFDRFLDEYSKCFTEKNYSAKIIPMTLEGCVVRISDIIAYIGRDIEDAVTLKIIERSEIPHEVSEVLGDTNSSIINALISDIIVNSYDCPYLTISPDIYTAMKGLLKFNYERIYKNPSIKDEDSKLRNMFTVVYDRFYDQLASGDPQTEIYSDYLSSYNPEYFKKYSENNMQGRIVVDYISGMTDRYFNDCFTKFIMPKKFGKNIYS